MGLTVGGQIGADTAVKLEDCVAQINAVAETALAARDGAIILCHGGPIATPEDASYILARCHQCHGF